jgi:membrane-bound metal-dependent hydrolase YbcI (DUF457 family)
MVSAFAAGIFADLDGLSLRFGPSEFLTWHNTYIHSILAAAIFSFAFPALPDKSMPWGTRRISVVKSETVAEDLSESGLSAVISRVKAAFAACLCAAFLHIAMDASQSSGVALFWPFSSRRFAADWLPRIDPWILTILIACIAVPELLHLVSSEIGAKAKKPRGQTGALIGLTLVLLYTGVRATLHSNVIATMESRTFHGETPRRVNAFPETLSILAWRGVVETDSALDQIDVDAASTANFDADSSVRLFKPEPSPALDAARNTATAKRFLAVARIPKASVEKTESGYIVVLRDLRYAAAGETQHEVAAVIELDLNNKVISQELVWARELHR